MNTVYRTTEIPIILAERHRQEIKAIVNNYSLRELSGRRILLSDNDSLLGYWLLIAFDVLNCSGMPIQVTVITPDVEHFHDKHCVFRDAQWLTLKTREEAEKQGSRFDYVIHSFQRIVASGNNLTVIEDMLRRSHEMFQCTKNIEAARMLYVGDAEIYGSVPEGLDRIPEQLAPTVETTDHNWAYCQNLRAIESLGMCYGREYGFDFLSARCFPMFGYGLPKRMALQQFIHDALHADEIYVLGDGEAVRSYLYGADLAIWTLALLVKGSPGSAYNLGSDIGYRMEDLAIEVARALAPDKRVNVLNVYPSPPAPRLVPDITRIRRDTGVNVWTSLSQGILRMAQDSASHA